MKFKFSHVILPGAVVLLTACAGSSTQPGPGEQTNIGTEPAGATVVVDGDEIGITPMTVKPGDAFPAGFVGMTYQANSKLKFIKYGCKTVKVKVNDALLMTGRIFAKLECSDVIAREQVQQRPPMAAPAPVRQMTPMKSMPVAPAVEKTTESAIEQRLSKLRSLRDKGVISEQEYQKNRTRILSEL